jgi:hypothetical protein
MTDDQEKKMLEDWKAKQPADAHCRKPEHSLWEQCPEDCPYNTGVSCELRGANDD